MVVILLGSGFTISANDIGVFNSQSGESYTLSIFSFGAGTINVTTPTGVLIASYSVNGPGSMQIDLPIGRFYIIPSFSITGLMTKAGFSVGTVISIGLMAGVVTGTVLTTSGMCYDGEISPPVLWPNGIFAGQMSITGSGSGREDYRLCVDWPYARVNNLVASLDVMDLHHHLGGPHAWLRDDTGVLAKYKLINTATNEVTGGEFVVDIEKDYEAMNEFVEAHANVDEVFELNAKTDGAVFKLQDRLNDDMVAYGLDQVIVARYSTGETLTINLT